MKKRLISTLLISFGVTLSSCGEMTDQEKRIADLAEIFEHHYAEKIVQFEDENKTIGDIDVVFLGDSLTERYDVNASYPQYKVLNRGIGGDTSIGVETRLGVSVFEVKPKVTTMLIGVNNIDSMLDNYENILKKFQENAPEMKVVLLSLTSMTGDWAVRNETAIKNNVEIKKYAEKYNYEFIDLYNPLLDPSTNELKEEYSIDGGHINEKGYKVVTSLITPVLSKLID